MKSLILACCISCISLLGLDVQAQQGISEVVYLHRIKFNSLVSAGEKHSIIQYCTTMLDSVLQGKVTFEKAKIGRIDKCSASFYIVGDTVQRLQVETIRSANTRQLIKEALQKYGESYVLTNGDNYKTYSWKTPVQGRFVITSLKLDNAGSRGILVSEIE